jgi:hypothetical protein
MKKERKTERYFHPEKKSETADDVGVNMPADAISSRLPLFISFVIRSGHPNSSLISQSHFPELYYINLPPERERERTSNINNTTAALGVLLKLFLFLLLFSPGCQIVLHFRSS